MKEVTRVLFVVCVFFFAHTVSASTLYIEPQQADIYPGDTKALSVRLNTDEGECINAVDGVIKFTDNIIPVDISLGESIFPVWVESPVIDKANNRITFAGGIPNGYCGRIEGDPRLTNVILELIVQAPGTSQDTESFNPNAEITFGPETTTYLNDGAGTVSSVRTMGSAITVYEDPSADLVDEWSARIEDDKTPPNEFSIVLSSDVSAFGGKKFIAFNTTDKQSGIDHYEVIEEPFDQINIFNWGAVDAPWIVAKSPYLLRDQSLNSTIRVRALDKAGNEYIAILIPDESIRGISERNKLYIALVVLGFLLIIVLFIMHLVYKRKVDSDAIAETLEAQEETENNDDINNVKNNEL